MRGLSTISEAAFNMLIPAGLEFGQFEGKASWP